MDRSLRGLMMINRFRFIKVGVVAPIVTIPTTPTDPPVIPIQPVIPPLSTTYYSSDFGENAINNGNPNDASHSERCQIMFNYITRNFRDRCTSYQSYNTSLLGNKLFGPESVLSSCKLIKGDIIYTPYVGAAQWENADYHNFVLPVGSHYDNNNTDGIIDNNDRHDITPDKDTFLLNSVAVSCRRDTPTEFMRSTSYGFGMEFFEDTSPEGLDGDYPDRDVPIAFAEVRTSPDGLTLYGNRTMDMNTNPRLSIGEEITLINGSISEKRLVTNLLPDGVIEVNEPFTPFIVTDFITLKTIIGGVNTKIGEVGTEDNGTWLRAHNIKDTNFINVLSIGQTVTLTYPDSHVETKVVASVPKTDLVILTTSPTIYQIPGIYVWYNDTLGHWIWGQAESWATPLIAGKLKIIKMSTGADWNTVRMAARATAKRNPTGILEIDNANWDIYRGFGCIQVQDAIDYINN